MVWKATAVKVKITRTAAPYGLPIFAPAPDGSSTAVSEGVAGLVAKAEVFDDEQGTITREADVPCAVAVADAVPAEDGAVVAASPDEAATEEVSAGGMFLLLHWRPTTLLSPL
jgi:hypothetical protein